MIHASKILRSGTDENYKIRTSALEQINFITFMPANASDKNLRRSAKRANEAITSSLTTPAKGHISLCTVHKEKQGKQHFRELSYSKDNCKATFHGSTK